MRSLAYAVPFQCRDAICNRSGRPTKGKQKTMMEQSQTRRQLQNKRNNLDVQIPGGFPWGNLQRQESYVSD